LRPDTRWATTISSLNRASSASTPGPTWKVGTVPSGRANPLVTPKDGVLSTALSAWTATGASCHLFSKTRFSRNCVIRLEFNAAHAADSGICLHGSQFQVRDYINSLPDTQRFAAHCKPPGQWNELELDFTDGMGKIRLNGHEIVARFQLGNDPKRGLGLQREKGDFAYRRIRIREK